MNYIRSLLYGIPLFLLLLFVASFMSTASLSTKKKNEMSLGMNAEPVTLNPIQQADAASGLVTGFLFNGLLKENENLELVGSLASSWSLSQITTFYFHIPAEAEHAKNILTKEKVTHPKWSILSINSGKDPTQLVIILQEPGYHVSEEIAQLFPKETLFPISITPQESHLFTAEPIINFTLRHDVRWHDGVPFTSADVAFTYRAIMDDRVVSRLRSYFELISNIETPDPWHVIVHYRHPFSPALNSWTTLIIPAHLLEKKDPSLWGSYFNRHPIGTGPFCFDTWKSNEYVRLKKNNDYFLGSPWLDSIVFRILPDPLTLRLAFETHQIDFWDASPWAVKGCAEDPRFEVFAAPGNSYSYVGWNSRRPLFADITVRRALAHAVNIPAMIQYLLYGNGVPSTGIFTPRMWCFNPSIQPLSYDPQKAATLLDQAGWKVGLDGIRTRQGKRFSFTLLTSNGSTIGPDIATLLQDDFKKIGIEMNIEVFEWTVFLKKMTGHDFDAVVAAWALPDDCDQYELWDSSQSFPGGFNYTGYTNPHVDTLLKKIRDEYGHPELIQLAHELQQTLYQEQPYLFLFVPKHTSVLWKGTYRIYYPTDHGFVDSPLTPSKAGWNYNMEWFYRRDYPPDALHQR
ncbi:MAG: ABC transporter substrate-binding protein [Chthoniobacterales bacterium]